jgi:hypothetical protein
MFCRSAANNSAIVFEAIVFVFIDSYLSVLYCFNFMVI